MSDPIDPKDPPPETPETVELFADEPAPAEATGSDAELQAAVGLTALEKKVQKEKEKAEKKERKEREKKEKQAAEENDVDEDGNPRKKRGKGLLILALTIAVGGLIAGMVLLGRANESRLIFRCEKDKITARQGDGFPLPWGDHGLSGAQWKAIAIPPEAECDTRETESMAELEEWFLTKLMKEAEKKLLARDVTEVDQAEAELEQALLLARTSEREYLRLDIERLLGFVEYHRGNARIEQAIETLEKAAEQFDTARDRRAKNQSDADARAQWAREVARQLRAGPTGETREDGEATAPVGPRPDVTTGTALPVEPPTRVEELPETTPPDAGLPPVGVLL